VVAFQVSKLIELGSARSIPGMGSAAEDLGRLLLGEVKEVSLEDVCCCRLSIRKGPDF